jgi:hypothetical protein
MKVVDYKDWPKQTALRHTTLVAFIEDDLDVIAEKLSTKPKIYTIRATKTDPQEKYRCIFLVLSNRVPASLSEEYLCGKKIIELHLQVANHEFAFDCDLNEVISTLKLSPQKVHKFEGNFTWLPNRKAKRVKYKKEPYRRIDGTIC